MEDLPDDVGLVLTRGVGAYIRHTPTTELPLRVRRFKGFRPAALARHRAEILAQLDDPGMRARIVEWLDEAKPPLPKEEARLLRVAAAQEDGWLEELRGAGRDRPRVDAAPDERVADLERSLERERVKTAKAKEEARRERADAVEALRVARAEAAAAEQELTRVTARVQELERAAAEAERAAATAEERRDREVRRARRDADTARTDLERLRTELKDVRKELEVLRRDADTETPKKAARPKRGAPQAPEPAGPRHPLDVPKGRFEDAPETLAEWLDVPHVHLVVDGYNVTKAERGFGELELGVQRDRLIAEVTKLVRRKKARGTIVFDGSHVPAGIARAARGPLKVEYSRPDEIADDHIVALLEVLPPHPVVVVTNDRELQERARRAGATVATSDQLLALIR